MEDFYRTLTDVLAVYYFADLRMTFRQNVFSRLVQKQTWSRVRLGLGLGLGLGLELVFGKGFIVLVKPLVCYVLSL